MLGAALATRHRLPGARCLQCSQEFADRLGRPEWRRRPGRLRRACIAERFIRSFCPCLERTGRCNIVRKTRIDPQVAAESLRLWPILATDRAPAGRFKVRLPAVSRAPKKAGKLIILKGIVERTAWLTSLRCIRGFLQEMDDNARLGLQPVEIHSRFAPQQARFGTSAVGNSGGITVCRRSIASVTSNSHRCETSRAGPKKRHLCH